MEWGVELGGSDRWWWAATVWGAVLRKKPKEIDPIEAFVGW